MNDQEFDKMIQEALDETAPEGVVEDVTPWRRAMNQVLVGFVLVSLTLNFLLLNYILPTVGYILLLLGFRTLRRENKWFRTCWEITLLYISFRFLQLVLNTTIIHSKIYGFGMGNIWMLITFVLILVQYFCFWQGLRAIQEKAGMPIHTGGAVGLIIWYCMMYSLALVQYSGWIIFIVMIVSYVCIIRSLYKISKELDEAGYIVAAAPVRMSEQSLVIAIVLILGIGMASGYLFGGSYDMKWTPDETAISEQNEAIKTHLVSLGFPEEILNDLTDEDLQACEGALRVVVDVEEHPINEGREVREQEPGGLHIYTVYDVKELCITGVAVELPGEQEHWKIFHHFLWTVNPGFYGTESIQIWPAYRDIDGWGPDSEFTGQVLYDKDGQVYTAPYEYLGEEIYTSSNIFWGEQVSTDVFAAFSMPDQVENQRGYVSYTIQELMDGWIISSWMNYTHQRSWMQYPARTAMEQRKMNSWNEAGVFLTIQGALQFHPQEEDVELIH